MNIDMINVIFFSDTYMTGIKVATTAQDKAMVKFFTPVISFKRGRFFEKLMLYKIPRNNGTIRISNIKIFSKNPSINERRKEIAIEIFNKGSIFLMIIALSGIFIASSFKSVNLFNPYIPNAIKNVIIAEFNTKILYRKPEKMTMKEPIIPRKTEVKIRNDIIFLNINLILLNNIPIVDSMKIQIKRIQLDQFIQ